MDSYPPQYYEPKLQIAHLRKVAATILAQRDDVAENVFDEKKDTSGWGVSCLAYQRSKGALERLAATVDWLQVRSHNTLDCTLVVDGVVMRFCTSDDGSPRLKHLLATASEQAVVGQRDQLWLPMPDAAKFVGPAVWQIVLVRDGAVRVSKVMLMRATAGGTVLDKWELDVGDAGKVLPLVQPPRESPRPPTRLKKDKRDRDADES